MMVVPVQIEPAFTAGTARALFEGDYALDPVGNPNYDVSADGSRFLMITSAGDAGASDTPSQIHVVLNWSEALKARAPTGQ